MSTTADKVPVEILGVYAHRHGEFDRQYVDKLVRRDGRVYLIGWIFSGLDELRGGAVRSYLFDVREDQLAEIMPYFTEGSGVLKAHYDHDVIAILDGCREIMPSWWAWDLR